MNRGSNKARVDGRSAPVKSLDEAFFERAPVPLAVSRLSDGVILRVNRRLVEMTGTSDAEIIGRSAAEFYARSFDRDLLLRRLKEEGNVRDFEVEFRRDDETTFQASMSAELISVDGELCLYVSFEDITERKRAAEVLRESE